VSSESLLQLVEKSPLIKLNVGQMACMSNSLSIAIIELTRVRLRELDFNRCSKVSDLTIEAIARCCPLLTTLSLRACFEITDAGVSLLAENCTRLENLNLRNCDEVNDGSLHALAKLEHLQTLNLRGCYNVSSNGVSFLLQGCRVLTYLNLVACSQIQTEVVSRLAEAFAESDSRLINIKGPEPGARAVFA